MHYSEASQGHTQTNTSACQKPATQRKVCCRRTSQNTCPQVQVALCVEGTGQGCWGRGMEVVPSMQDKLPPCGFMPAVGHRDTATVPPAPWLGTVRAGPLPATTFALLPMDQLCSESSGLYVGQARHWLQHCHEVIQMNKDPQFSLHPTPLMPSPWQRAALALILEKKSISLRLWAHLSKASMLAAPGPAWMLCPVHPPEQRAPCLPVREESSVLGGEQAV